MDLMDYEKEIFIDSFNNDGLLVMAKGLGIERILLSFIKLYCEPTNLVLVLNVMPQEEEYFKEALQKSGVPFLPRSINAEVGIADRQKMYPEGGVLFVTTRILVVDMLVGRIPIGHVTGIIINRAHKVIESCQEAFILRLYRQKNKTGFIKAFSENAPAFSKGFCQIERVMKSLYLANLHLWPRFRESVVEHFERNKIDVVELHVHMTELMTDCQSCLLDLIDGCLKEIKRCHAILDMEELSVEFALTKSFDKILRLQLDPIWHQLSQKTRQIVSDLRLLRNLLEDLVHYDSVNFCNQVDMLRNNVKNFNSNVGWLFTDSADRLFLHSRERIGIGKNMPISSSSLDVELSPKWIALKEVLEEVDQQADDFILQSKGSPSAFSERSKVNVLVLALNEKMCKQIYQFLKNPEEFTSKLGDNYRSLKKNQETVNNEPSEKKRKFVKKKATFDGNPTDVISDAWDEGSVLVMMSSLQVTIHPIRDREDPNDINRKLEELQPQAIILYNAEVNAVRKIEVFRATKQDDCTLKRVYFLTYTGSTEEQGYLTVLRREKEAFEGLIRQKATMVIPQEREGKHDNDEGQLPTNENTRKGGLATGTGNIQKVVVDMREFRSELPSLLHKRGISIDPVTLEVGDYILTPDICVERKSVPDLVGSLNNGRLYNQCLAMCRTYKRPVLLIEFNPNKPFTLQDKFPLSNDISSNDVVSRLALLTLHFPKLRTLWCQSPHATAELFEELKVEREQPVADVAAMVTSSSEEKDDNQSKHLDRYNSTPQDMLSKMPGVNIKNIYSIMNNVESLVHLTQLSVQQLTDIMGSSSNATLLHEFLNTTPAAVEPKDNKTTKSNPRAGKQRFSLNKFAKT